MQLHLKTKEIAWGGMLMALAVILIVLSGVIEASSMFLLAAAAFLAGICRVCSICFSCRIFKGQENIFCGRNVY